MCLFSPLLIERESLAVGPASLALIDKMESFCRGAVAADYQPRFTINVHHLIAAGVGNAELVDDALQIRCVLSVP